MQQSLEIRWFYKEDKERKEVLDWFHAIEGGIDNPSNERTDFYLNHFFKGALGIKLRGEQLELEIKEKMESAQQHPWNDCGVVEVYNKCEFNQDSKDTVFLNTVQGNDHRRWIAVQKKRKLLKIDTNRSITIYPGNHPIDDGCSVELTKLHVQGKRWSTFCVEAFAKEKDIHENLDEVLEYINATFNRIKHILHPKASMGYPLWLYSITHL